MIPIRWPDAALLSPPRWSPVRRVRWGAISLLVVVALVTGTGMARAGRHAGPGRTARRTRTMAATAPLGAPSRPTPKALPAKAPAAPPGALAAVPASARIGAIFTGDDDHHCTASVVGPDLILTAAHCSTDGDRFSPGFRMGRHPYGLWRLGPRVVDHAWNADHDEDHDIAFVQVKLQNGRHIGDVVGFNPIRFDPGFGLRVTVTGYPSDQPAAVSGSDRTARYSDHQMRVSVPGMAGGTSGGPWITGGTVVGVIGGHDEGGAADDVSYSVYFDASVRKLYETAAAKSGSPARSPAT